jgi:hypothetical protein
MGSSGSKRNHKGEARQHLPKVGTRDEIREEQHLEREAIADTMGFGRAPGWVKWMALCAGTAILILGVVTLIALD